MKSIPLRLSDTEESERSERGLDDFRDLRVLFFAIEVFLICIIGELVVFFPLLIVVALQHTFNDDALVINPEGITGNQSDRFLRCG